MVLCSFQGTIRIRISDIRFFRRSFDPGVYIIHVDLLKSTCILSFSVSHSQVELGMVGSSGLEPPTSRLSGVRSNRLSYEPSSNCFFGCYGGDKRDRTADPLLARQVLSQLSYTPTSF